MRGMAMSCMRVRCRVPCAVLRLLFPGGRMRFAVTLRVLLMLMFLRVRPPVLLHLVHMQFLSFLVRRLPSFSFLVGSVMHFLVHLRVLMFGVLMSGMAGALRDRSRGVDEHQQQRRGALQSHLRLLRRSCHCSGGPTSKYLICARDRGEWARMVGDEVPL